MTGIVNYECFNGAVSAIAGNVKVLCAVWDLMHYTFNIELKLIKGTNAEFTTSAHIAQNTCYKLAAVFHTETSTEVVTKRI